MDSELTSLDDIAWLTSLRDDYAGAWLERAPKSYRLSIDSREFEIAIRLRFRVKIPSIQEGHKCDCSNNNGSYERVLDGYGIHLCSGCNRDGTRIGTHDAVVKAFRDMLSHGGVSSTLEERQVYADTDPDNNKRGDITAMRLPGTNLARRQVLDITIVSPVHLSQSTRLTSMNKAKQKFYEADKAAAKKREKHQQCADNSNLGFIPIVFEITGAIHIDAIKVMKNVQKDSSRTKNCEEEKLFRFWVSIISMTLQRNLARGIIIRCRTYNGRSLREDTSVSNNAINEFEYMH